MIITTELRQALWDYWYGDPIPAWHAYITLRAEAYRRGISRAELIATIEGDLR